MNKKLPTILLIDSNALVHRAYHAIPQGMATRSGELTNAIYGFASALFHALETIKPTAVICCFDVKGETFRHQQYDQYKAQRKEMDAQLAGQLPRIYELVNAFNIPIVSKEGYEADDIIGTLAKRLEADAQVMILTGDKDELQLISERTSVVMMKSGSKESPIYTPKTIMDEYGITPHEFITFKALRGDPSDNIPGVDGVGEVTALKLVQRYHSLDELYAALEKPEKDHPLLKGKLRERLIADKDTAYLSYSLSTIDRAVVLPKLVVPDALIPDMNQVKKLFTELEFTSLTNRLPKVFDNAPSALQPLPQNDAAVHHISHQKMAQTLKKLDKGRVAIALCYEGASVRGGKIQALAISEDGKSGRVADWHESLIAPLSTLLANKSIHKVLSGAKDIIHLMSGREITDFFDCMIASQLLEEPIPSHNIRTQSELSDETKLRLGAVAAELFTISKQLVQKLDDAKLTSVWQAIEQPLIPVVARMEQTGVLVDTKFLENLSKDMTKRLDNLQTSIWHEAGQEFNISSPQQLSTILFDKLGLVKEGVKKKNTGFSTDASTLESLKGTNPIIEHILQYRELSKLKGTYVDVLPTLVDAKDKRIHTTYNQIGAATGRLSSNDPNLQNIPIRTEVGQLIRHSFIASSGYSLLSCDYSQFELRILAHLSGDSEMQQSFADHIDIHTATAAKVHGIEIKDVTKEMRRAAKAINFGILYGLSPHSLARQLDIGYDQAKQFIDRYFASYPKVKAFIDSVVDKSKKDGQYRTLFGRRRLFPEFQSPAWVVKQAGERMAMNFPMQGTQADILKMAMIAVSNRYIGDPEVRLLLSVHDELVLEVKTGRINTVAKEVVALMAEVTRLAVPIAAEASVGLNWGEMKSIE